MKYKEIQKTVEKRILELFKMFCENPAVFLSEADVKCYLYHLLVSDPLFRDSSSIVEQQTPREKSRTFLVHAETRFEIRGKTKSSDIMIWKPGEKIDIYDWETIIGIEIKFNRRLPARKEKSNIIEDIKKVSDNKSGYVLLLNWDRPIEDDQLKQVSNLLKQHKNVKFYYLDIFSDPPKTNLKLPLMYT